MLFTKTVILLLIYFTSSSLYAASYYVKPNGNDRANGKTHASAWKTISKVNKHKFRRSDNVYLLAGGSWNEQLRVHWGGTKEKPAVVGSYYLNANKVVIGMPAKTKKPTLTGNYPLVNVRGALPRRAYAGLVQVNANYVTIKNIRVENSSGSGIALNKARHHAIFEYNEVDTTAGSSIIFNRKTHHNIMRNNHMQRCATAWKDKKWIGKTWPVCNGAIGSKHNLIENNTITESYGEGIVAFDIGANHNTIRGNKIKVLRTVGIYIDNGANNIVENNLITGHNSKRKKGAAFALNVESYPRMRNAVNNIFRNNLMSNLKMCWWVGVEPKARKKGYKVGADIIGNTCVGTESTIKIFPADDYIEQISVMNNIFLDFKNNDCKLPSSSKINFSHNLWSLKQIDSNCHSKKDVIAHAQLNIQSDNHTLSLEKLPKISEFKPKPGSPAIKRGTDNPKLTKDFYGKKRPSPPSIGAIDINSPARSK